MRAGAAAAAAATHHLQHEASTNITLTTASLMAERGLRKTMSELNLKVNKNAPPPFTRRHLYSLCLQRIMIVEFEYLAHKSLQQWYVYWCCCLRVRVCVCVCYRCIH
jgi:hypothetical protein